MKTKGINTKVKKRVAIIVLVTLLIGLMTACGTKSTGRESNASLSNQETTESEETQDTNSEEATETASDTEGITGAGTSGNSGSVITTANVTSDGALDASSLFTERDLTQSVDLEGAETISLKSGEDISITKEGVYVIQGTATDVTITVEAGDSDKVQLVLDGASITNEDAPAIYVINADKVFVTTTEGENNLQVTGEFTPDGTTNLDAVIFSRDDVILNGLGTLNITSSANGISGKDDVKITGGTINIQCTADGVEANESILMAEGTVNISTNKDGFHAENDEDSTTGYIYICGGNITVDAADDAIHGTTIVQIDGGNLNLSGTEAIEATYIQINDGTIDIYASDDGINASAKSNAYAIAVEFNGGYTTIEMGQGDTDAVDSNGDIYVNGGTLDIYAQSPFDYDGYAEMNGGTIIVNGVETNEITNQMMGGGGFGGPGGGPGGGFGGHGGFGG